VPAKDPNRRKSRSGSRARANGVHFDSRPRKSSSNPRARSRLGSGSFVLYVEGARDREIIECWARRIDPGLSRCIERSTVILGGRRPARAIADFQKRGGAEAGYRGLVVLDRDDLPHTGSIDANFAASKTRTLPPADGSNPSRRRDEGLEVFVWSLRHIESYLLVPAAIRRMLRLAADARTVDRFIEINHANDATSVTPSESPEPSMAGGGTTRLHGSLHAKRVIGAGGSLSQALGVELRAGDIARAMRVEDLHGDVHNLFDRIGTLSGLATRGPEVVIRPS